MNAQKFREMYKEFKIGCLLKHPLIVSYMYFLRQDSKRLGPKEQEFHILIELCEGGNLAEYVAKYPNKQLMQKTRLVEITKQIVEALVYLHS